MPNLPLTGFDAGICKPTDVYVAVDTTVMPNGQNKKYTLQQIATFVASEVSPLDFKGTWNATTNTPTLVSSVGTPGDLYVVGVAGNTNLNGITTWDVGDWVLFNGTVWERIPALNTGNVVGPASATDNAIGRYDGTTGKIIQNSVITIDDVGVIQGASIPAIGNTVTAIALGTNAGDVIVNAGAPPIAGDVLTAISAVEAEWQPNSNGNVVGPASATDNAIPRYDTTTGKLIQNSVVTIGDTGIMAGVTIPKTGNAVTAANLATSGADVVIEGSAPPVAGQAMVATSSTTAGWQSLPGIGDVIGPSSSTDSAIALYNGATGKILKNSQWTVDATFQSVTGTTFTWSYGADTLNADALTFSYRQGLDPFADALILNTDGNINSPVSACFWAERNTPVIGITGAGLVATLSFNLVFLDQNNNFSSGTTFTAPVTGIYDLSAIIRVGFLDPVNDDLKLNFVVQGTPYVGQHFNPSSMRVIVTGQAEVSVPVRNLVTMNAGDTAVLQLTVLNGPLNTVAFMGGSFQGRLCN